MITSEYINQLPKELRDYIRDLETMCDPSGMVQEIASLKEQRDALLKLKQEDITTEQTLIAVVKAVTDLAQTVNAQTSCLKMLAKKLFEEDSFTGLKS